MTDYNKYRNVSLSNETYEKLIVLSKSIIPNVKLSISKTIETVTKEKFASSKIPNSKKKKGSHHLINV
ncbi:hypothetical protein N9U73_00330 [Candidatus Pelagibacter bacterium]|nr:hypothetical protein [Candidatus Pelagibacter bacterium]